MRPTGITTDCTDLTDKVRTMPLQKPPVSALSAWRVYPVRAGAVHPIVPGSQSDSPSQITAAFTKQIPRYSLFAGAPGFITHWLFSHGVRKQSHPCCGSCHRPSIYSYLCINLTIVVGSFNLIFSRRIFCAGRRVFVVPGGNQISY